MDSKADYQLPTQCTGELAWLLHCKTYLWEASQLHTQEIFSHSWYCLSERYSTDQIHSWIHAPMKEGAWLLEDPITWAEVLAFNHQILSFHQTTEWENRMLQWVFSWLCVSLSLNYKCSQATILECCVHLCNICMNKVGLNQICTMYISLWRDGTEKVWLSFQSMLFMEQHRNNCV